MARKTARDGGSIEKKDEVIIAQVGRDGTVKDTVLSEYDHDPTRNDAGTGFSADESVARNWMSSRIESLYTYPICRVQPLRLLTFLLWVA